VNICCLVARVPDFVTFVDATCIQNSLIIDGIIPSQRKSNSKTAVDSRLRDWLDENSVQSSKLTDAAGSSSKRVSFLISGVRVFPAPPAASTPTAPPDPEKSAAVGAERLKLNGRSQSQSNLILCSFQELLEFELECRRLTLQSNSVKKSATPAKLCFSKVITRHLYEERKEVLESDLLTSSVYSVSFPSVQHENIANELFANKPNLCCVVGLSEGTETTGNTMFKTEMWSYLIKRRGNVLGEFVSKNFTGSTTASLSSSKQIADTDGSSEYFLAILMLPLSAPLPSSTSSSSSLSLSTGFSNTATAPKLAVINTVSSKDRSLQLQRSLLSQNRGKEEIKMLGSFQIGKKSELSEAEEPDDASFSFEDANTRVRPPPPAVPTSRNLPAVTGERSEDGRVKAARARNAMEALDWGNDFGGGDDFGFEDPAAAFRRETSTGAASSGKQATAAESNPKKPPQPNPNGGREDRQTKSRDDVDFDFGEIPIGKSSDNGTVHTSAANYKERVNSTGRFDEVKPSARYDLGKDSENRIPRSGHDDRSNSSPRLNDSTSMNSTKPTIRPGSSEVRPGPRPPDEKYVNVAKSSPRSFEGNDTDARTKGGDSVRQLDRERTVDSRSISSLPKVGTAAEVGRSSASAARLNERNTDGAWKSGATGATAVGHGNRSQAQESAGRVTSKSTWQAASNNDDDFSFGLEVPIAPSSAADNKASYDTSKSNQGGQGKSPHGSNQSAHSARSIIKPQNGHKPAQVDEDPFDSRAAKRSKYDSSKDVKSDFKDQQPLSLSSSSSPRSRTEYSSKVKATTGVSTDNRTSYGPASAQAASRAENTRCDFGDRNRQEKKSDGNTSQPEKEKRPAVTSGDRNPGSLKDPSSGFVSSNSRPYHTAASRGNDVIERPTVSLSVQGPKRQSLEDDDFNFGDEVPISVNAASSSSSPRYESTTSLRQVNPVSTASSEKWKSAFDESHAIRDGYGQLAKRSKQFHGETLDDVSFPKSSRHPSQSVDLTAHHDEGRTYSRYVRTEESSRASGSTYSPRDSSVDVRTSASSQVRPRESGADQYSPRDSSVDSKKSSTSSSSSTSHRPRDQDVHLSACRLPSDAKRVVPSRSSDVDGEDEFDFSEVPITYSSSSSSSASESEHRQRKPMDTSSDRSDKSASHTEPPREGESQTKHGKRVNRVAIPAAFDLDVRDIASSGDNGAVKDRSNGHSKVLAPAGNPSMQNTRDCRPAAIKPPADFDLHVSEVDSSIGATEPIKWQAVDEPGLNHHRKSIVRKSASADRPGDFELDADREIGAGYSQPFEEAGPVEVPSASYKNSKADGADIGRPKTDNIRMEFGSIIKQLKRSRGSSKTFWDQTPPDFDFEEVGISAAKHPRVEVNGTSTLRSDAVGGVTRQSEESASRFSIRSSNAGIATNSEVSEIGEDGEIQEKYPVDSVHPKLATKSATSRDYGQEAGGSYARRGGVVVVDSALHDAGGGRGRGRAATLPAWMSGSEEAQLDQLDGSSRQGMDYNHAIVEDGEVSLGQGHGRGRAKVLPAWMTEQKNNA
jgi:hypothetical protein